MAGGVGHVVSHHLLRRRAREAAWRWNDRAKPSDPLRAVVRPYKRGPWGFKVVLERKRLPVD